MTAGTEKLPVVYLHSFRGDGEDVWKACREAGCPPFALVSVNNPGTGFDDELSPWPAEGVWKRQAPYKGLASEHLGWLTEQCIPEVEARIAATARTPSATTATPVACPGSICHHSHTTSRPARRHCPGRQSAASEPAAAIPPHHRRLLPSRTLRPLGSMELGLLPQSGDRLRLNVVSRIQGIHQEQRPTDIP